MCGPTDEVVGVAREGVVHVVAHERAGGGWGRFGALLDGGRQDLNAVVCERSKKIGHHLRVNRSWIEWIKKLKNLESNDLSLCRNCSSGICEENVKC